jgi:hypothetical protein
VPEVKARLKTEVQDVWQNIEPTLMHRYAPTWVHGCTCWHSDGLYLVRGPDKQMVDVGDYLVRDLDGAPLWMMAADFRRDYEVVE